MLEVQTLVSANIYVKLMVVSVPTVRPIFNNYFRSVRAFKEQMGVSIDGLKIMEYYFAKFTSLMPSFWLMRRWCIILNISPLERVL